MNNNRKIHTAQSIGSAALLIILLLAGGFSSPAQIPVSKEPMHHVVFQNAWVRLLDVHIPAGDTSLMHKHEIPSVFIVLTNTKTGSEVVVEPAKLQLTPGNIWFEGFYTSPRIHRVWNSDTSEFHVIDMELLNKTIKQIDSPLNAKEFTLLFDEKPVRGYRFTVGPHATMRIPARKAPLVIVGLSDASGFVRINNKTFEKKGDYLFVPANTAVNAVGMSATGRQFALLELK